MTRGFVGVLLIVIAPVGMTAGFVPFPAALFCAALGLALFWSAARRPRGRS